MVNTVLTTTANLMIIVTATRLHLEGLHEDLFRYNGEDAHCLAVRSCHALGLGVGMDEISCSLIYIAAQQGHGQAAQIVLQQSVVLEGVGQLRRNVSGDLNPGMYSQNFRKVMDRPSIALGFFQWTVLPDMRHIDNEQFFRYLNLHHFKLNLMTE